MKIRAKILSGYLFVCAVFTVMLVVGYFGTIQTTSIFSERANQSLRAEEVLDDLRYSAMRIVTSSVELAWLVRQGGSTDIEEEENELVEHGEAVYRAAAKRLTAVTLAEPDKDHAAQIIALGDTLVAVGRRLTAAAKGNASMQELLEIKEDFEKAETNFVAALQHAMDEEKELYASEQARMERVIQRAFLTIGSLALVMLVISAGGSLALSNRIAAPIQRLREAAERLALGDRSVAVRRESKDEVGDLAESFAVMAAARGTAEVKLERQAAELSERNEELKSFAWVASHDLREPLVTMRGFAGELKRTLHDVDAALVSVLPLLDEKKRLTVVEGFQYDIPEAFGFIESSIAQMESQIYSIQRLSQLGHLEIVPRPTDTAEIMNSLLQDVDEGLQKIGGEIRVGAMPVVMADRGILMQVIGHLLENAMKYREPNRPLVITIGAIETPTETTFHVRDNGRGISGDDVNRVFNMFRSAGQTEKGRGMGLTYVKALVRRMGGRIWCVSKIGEGSTFSFTIPVGDHERSGAATADTAGA